jgi:hypothetical protein
MPTERYTVVACPPAWRVVDGRTNRTIREKTTREGAQLLADILNGVELPANHSAYDRAVAAMAAEDERASVSATGPDAP